MREKKTGDAFLGYPSQPLMLIHYLMTQLQNNSTIIRLL